MRVAHIQASDNMVIGIDEDANIPFAEGFYKVSVDEIEAELVYVGLVYDPATKTAVLPPEKPEVPAIVSPRQARLALLSIGLLDAVEQALANIPGATGAAARIDWEYATEVRRDSPLIATLGPALGLSNAQIDDLFRMAATL